MVLRSKEDGWAMLASSIIESGIKSNDERFLNSNWCEALKELVMLNAMLQKRETYEYTNRNPQRQIQKTNKPISRNICDLATV